MLEQLRQFWGNEEGQDLVEYTFLIALVALGSISLLRSQGAGVSTIWIPADATLHNAANAVVGPS